MPSAFAHAAVGASIGGLLPDVRARGLAIVALGALAAGPDLDVIGFHFGVAYADPLGHRGLSHALPFAAFVGALSWPLWRRVGASRPLVAAGLTALAIASHGLLDLFTDAGLGVGLFLPFDDTRYFAGWRPIRTSPLSVEAFFQEAGLRILESEAIFIAPLLVLLWGGVLVSRRSALARSRSPGGDPE